MTIKLAVTERDENTKLDTLRASGKIPAVVYGPKQEAIAIAIDSKTFDKVRKEAGESTIIELEGLKVELEVLIQEVEFNPVKQEVLHADLYAVERGKEMTTNVALEFIGEAPVEASKTGNLNKVLHEVNVTCKPKDLPSHIDVDLSTLVNLDDKILIKDLKVSAGVKIEADDEDPVVVVSAMREEVEEEAPALDMDAIEVEQKGKGEEAGETKGE
jgi:large subunit ribosomal protein L25